MMFVLLPFLFEREMGGVSSISEEAGQQQGGLVLFRSRGGDCQRRMEVIPFSQYRQLRLRTDWFARSASKFPETGRVYDAGKRLSHIILSASELGHGFGDNPMDLSLLWSLWR